VWASWDGLFNQQPPPCTISTRGEDDEVCLVRATTYTPQIKYPRWPPLVDRVIKFIVKAFYRCTNVMACDFTVSRNVGGID
jgi:hypothetical protein